MLSLKELFNEEFIFIFRTETFDKEFIDEINNKIGIKRYKFKIIDECTEGQATTAFKANDLIKVNESVIIYSINIHIISDILSIANINKDIDVFVAICNEKYSKYKKGIDENNIAGLYYFKAWEDFTYIYNKYISYIKIKNSEACMENMIEYLIKEGKIVQTQLIPNSYIHKLNTPQAIKLFTDKLN